MIWLRAAEVNIFLINLKIRRRRWLISAQGSKRIENLGLGI